MSYLAHKDQPLTEHLNETERLAGQFADVFYSRDWAAAAGRLHDLGKLLDGFQRKIHAAYGLEYEYEDEHAGGASNHSGVGAAFAEEHYDKACGRTLAYLIAGHHTGLPDYYRDKTGQTALEFRLPEAKKELNEVRNYKDKRIISFTENLPQLKPPPFVKAENYHFWARMLFSCLVDADYLDTEHACTPDKTVLRQQTFPSLAELKKQFDEKLQTKINHAEQNELNQLRGSILAQCRNKGQSETTGLFTLTVPTGGGKTLSSMAFALEHAVKHHKERIIYVIPYTSIIEQTADEFRRYLGSENVVEHHSNIDTDTDPNTRTDKAAFMKMELAAENWDAPIIITTNVQFFESLYSAKTKRCRKLHNIANSVVIIDEAQLITPEYVLPCVDALNQLTAHYKTSVVLCTATQPALPKLNPAAAIIENISIFYEKLKRVEYHFPQDLNEKTTWEQIAEKLKKHKQVLCVVNTRTDCRMLYNLLKDEEGTVHLSALMCGEHRSSVIADIKKRLEDNKPLRVISTQLIEAGVDIDFPVVYRALAGLDSIVQAAGRCNREGKLEKGDVFIFIPPKPSPTGLLRKREDTSKECLPCDLHNPESYPPYFHLFYSKLAEQGERILNDLKCTKEGVVYFRSVSQSFHLIDDDYTMPVIVRYGKSPALLEQLQKDGFSKDLMRQLQRFTVNVPKSNAAKLLQSGLVQRLTIQSKESDVLVQYGKDCYSEQFGLDLQKQEFSADECVL